MAGYMLGKLDIIFRSRKYQGSQDQSHVKWQMHGMKHLYLQFYQGTSWRTYTVPIIIIINNFFFVGMIQYFKILQIVFRPKKLIKANYKPSKMKVLKDTFQQSFKLHNYWEQKHTHIRAQTHTYSHAHIDARTRIRTCKHTHTHI